MKRLSRLLLVILGPKFAGLGLQTSARLTREPAKLANELAHYCNELKYQLGSLKNVNEPS